MKTLLATLLATAASASFASAPTAALNHDPATYRNVTQKAAADYKAAAAKCGNMSGNEKDVCQEEAKAARAHAEADAIAQYNNTAKGRARSRATVADADYALAKARCAAMSGADKDDCMNNARSVHTAALADAKAGRETATASSGVDGTGLVANTSTRDPEKAAAVDKCAQLAGSSKTGCLIENRAPVTAATGATTASGPEIANRTENAAATVADKTRSAAATAAEKTKEVAQTAVEKSKQAASTIAQKTERATDTAATSDTAITTKVKANIFKEPELKSMAIHVETEKGVVMLSGFVDSKAEADKAVQVARSVDGVTNVKSAIKVK